MDGKVKKIKLCNINSRNKADSNKLNCSDDKLCKSDDNLNKAKRCIEDKNQITSLKLNKNNGKPSIFTEARNNEKRNTNKNLNCDINNLKNNTILGNSPKISNKRNNGGENKISEDGKILNSNNFYTSDTNLINNKIHDTKKISSLITKIMKSNTDNIINLISKIDKSSPITNCSYKNNVSYQKGDNDYTNLIKTEKKNNKTASTVCLDSDLKSSRKESNIEVDYCVSESNVQNEKEIYVDHNDMPKNDSNENSRTQFSFINIENKFNHKLQSLNFNEKIYNGNTNDIKSKELINDEEYTNKNSNTCNNEDVSRNCKELLKIISKYKLLTTEKFPEYLEIFSNKEKINNLNGELNNLKKETLDLYIKLKDSSEENKPNLESQKVESFQSVKYNLKIIDISSDRRMSFYKNCFDLCLESLKEIKNDLSSCKPQTDYESKNLTNIIENNIVINKNENCGNNLNLNVNLNLNSLSPTNTNPRNKVTKKIEIRKFKKKQMSFKKFKMESCDNSVNSSESMMSEGIKVKLPYFNYFVNKPKEQNLKFKKLSRKFTYKKINFNFNQNKNQIPKSNSNSEEFECNSLNETIILKENEYEFQKGFELKNKMRLRSKSVLNVDFNKIETAKKKAKFQKEKFLLNDDSVHKVIYIINFIDF